MDYRQLGSTGTRVSELCLVDTGQDDDGPDVAGVKLTLLDARQWERGDDLFRYVF